MDTTPAPPVDEAELFEQLRRGSRPAFAALTCLYQPAMLAVAMAYTRHEAGAQRLIQRTWEIALPGLDMFGWRCSLQAWVTGILAGIGRPHAVAPPAPRMPPRPAAAGAPGPRDWRDMPWGQRWSDMAWELAREAVAALPIPQREAAELGAIHGWGPRDVCDTLGLTHERYAARLQSAHKEVHDLLATWLGEDPAAVPASLRTLRAVPVGQLLADLRPEHAPPAADLDVVFRRWRAARRRARFAAALRRLGRDATPPTRPAIPTTAPLLVADQLVAGYDSDVNILNGCSLELRAGELVGVIGPNGAGKSTLIKAMFGLVATRAGSVILRGEDVTGLPAHELVSRGVGYVPQRANVFPTLTVQENLEVGVYLNPRLWRQQFGFVVEFFPLLGERRRQRVGALSGGERKMVALGRALMAAPTVLLLDEPSAGLSPANQEVVFRRVRDTRNAGISVVMVEQNARRGLEICDRAYVLDQGRNAYSGAGTELLGDPKVIELYLGTLARAS